MAHPIYQDPPSRDMSEASSRQATLDEQIAAFLARGGEIKAFDTLRRPVESVPWNKFSLAGSNPPLVAAQPKRREPLPVAPRIPKAKPAQAPETAPCPTPVEPVPAAETVPAKPKSKRLPNTLRAADERLAVKIIVAAALGGAPRVIARELAIPLNRCLTIAKQCHVQFHA